MAEVRLELPDPPDGGPDGPLATHKLPAGASLWRVACLPHGPAAFDRRMSHPDRFRPLRDAQGEPVTSLYAAASPETALYETVLRNIAGSGGPRLLRQRQYRDRYLVLLEPREPLTLVELSGAPARRALRLAPEAQQLLTGGPLRCYPQTRAWGEWLHAYSGTHQVGLTWMSRQHAIARCVRLFGDRITGRDVRVIETLRLDEPGAGRDHLVAAANAVGASIGWKDLR